MSAFCRLLRTFGEVCPAPFIWNPPAHTYTKNGGLHAAGELMDMGDEWVNDLIKGGIIGLAAVAVGIVAAPYLSWIPFGTMGAQVVVTAVGYWGAKVLKVA